MIDIPNLKIECLLLKRASLGGNVSMVPRERVALDDFFLFKAVEQDITIRYYTNDPLTFISADGKIFSQGDYILEPKASIVFARDRTGVLISGGTIAGMLALRATNTSQK